MNKLFVDPPDAKTSFENFISLRVVCSFLIFADEIVYLYLLVCGNIFIGVLRGGLEGLLVINNKRLEY